MPPVDDNAERSMELVPVMISALEHYSYCPRQCALIHLDQSFEENTYTLRGNIAHERVDDPDTEIRPEIRREYALPIWSDRLGLYGRADMVKFTAAGVYPVEHKVGKKRRWGHETLQLCAQGLCLEEMTGKPVERGAIYYHGSRARREVTFDDALRQLVIDTTQAVRDTLAGTELPAPVNDARCRHCSLIDTCMPTVSVNAALEDDWLERVFSIREG